MQRPEAEVGRRPLLLGQNRQMLLEIRDNLRHLQKNPQPGDSARGELKGELSQSTPNLVEKMGNGSKNMSRMGYNKNAMAKIRQSLINYEIQEVASPGLSVPNGPSIEATPVNEHMLQELKQMGCDEDLASRALKMTGNKSVNAALDLIQNFTQFDGKNGFDKAVGTGFPHPGYGTKVYRKPSFEEKYRQGSPVNSENSSVRSDSPSLNVHRPYGEGNKVVFNNGPPTGSVINDRSTPPPPLPPRGVPPTHTPPPPPPLPSQALSEAAVNHLLQQQQSMAAAGNYVSSVMKKMSPMLPHRDAVPQTWTAATNSPAVPHRGLSPVLGRQQAPVIMQNTLQHLPSGGALLHPQFQGVDMPAVITVPQGGQRFAVPYGYPPPYPQGQLLPNKPSPTSFPMQMHEQSHMIVPQFQGNSSPLSHSPSPGRVPSPAQAPSPAMQIYGQHLAASPSSPPGQVKTPAPMQAWEAKQSPIIMQQVKSREVQKPVLQTATAPPIPQHTSPQMQHQKLPQPSYQQLQPHSQHQQQLWQQQLQQLPNYVSSVQAQVNTPPSQGATAATPPQPLPKRTTPAMRDVQIEISRPQLPGYHIHLNSHLQGQKIHINSGPSGVHIQNSGLDTDVGYSHQHPYPQRQMALDLNYPTPRSDSPVSRATNQSPMSMISSVSTPSTNSDIPDKPPPPYPGRHMQMQTHHIKVAPHVNNPNLNAFNAVYRSAVNMEQPWSTTEDSSSQQSHPPDITSTDTDDQQSTNSENEWEGKRLCSSPKPIRKPEAEKKDAENLQTKIRHFSPQAFKFFMEQRVENIFKSHHQRLHRRMQLEKEMAKVGLSDEAQTQMRKMLYQKESNYIRLKRAKMDKYMFDKIKTLGVGAFGEVALVRKMDTGHLYAMKTLRKNDVLQRNQVAHVKAERDILAEADNEWVVKLYYSFQDKDNLYFVMDYIPGGDMMSLLIKFGIFKEPLACFYVAELVVAIESVHKMGFIHRDIKPDNILIDRDGHIKLTDFGLCTGFRWTHNSKYYQKGNHPRQDSMEPDETWGQNCDCHSKKELLKPLERRNRRHQRCLAHSLVGTPNYIAPEVLLRSGYTSCCDWWSVGVILYEMLVGQPPFLASTPVETQMKVIQWEDTLRIPGESHLSSEAKDLILSLCCGPEERLGRNNSVDIIKKHPFFRSINFQDLRRQPAPYQPQIRYATDTSNFDPVDPEKIRSYSSTESLDQRTSSLENGKHPELQHAFFEFTFRRFFDDGGLPIKLRDPDSNAPVYV